MNFVEKLKMEKFKTIVTSLVDFVVLHTILVTSTTASTQDSENYQ